MSRNTGKCPGCDSDGPIAKPCPERGCKKSGLHFIEVEHWRRAHPEDGANLDPVIGQMVGDFLVVGLLGAGGFGKVYLALQTPLLRLKGALKLIDFSTDDAEFTRAMLKKFQGEAEVLAHLTHPNIVRLLKYGIHARRPYLVMEFVNGGRTFRDEIYTRTVDERGFSPDEIVHIFDQVLNGLAAAHVESIIHRDIKPENIMLQSVVGNPHHIRLLDFGLAKFVEHHSDTRWHLGSPNYMAPEQISRKNLGPWTDLYAVAVMVYELMSGRRPFPGATDNEVMVKKIDERFDPLDEIEDLDFPRPALDFLGTGLKREPTERFQHVEEFRSALHEAVESLADRLGPKGATLEARTAHLRSGDIQELIEEPTPPEETLKAQSAEYPPDHDAETLRANGVAYPPLPSADDDDEEDEEDEEIPEIPDEEPEVEPEVEDSAPDEQPVEDSAPDEPDEQPVEDEDENLDEPVPERGPRVGMLAVAVVVLALIGVAVASFNPDDGEAVEENELSAEVPADDDEPLATVSSEEPVDAGTGDASEDEDAGAADTGTEEEEDAVVAEEDEREILEMALGKFHSCVLLRGGDVRCWGGNRDGELGLGHRNSVGNRQPANSIDPVDIGGAAIHIAASGDHDASFTCALLESRDVRCWGNNRVGQLGYGHTQRIGDDETPAEVGTVELGGPVKQLAAGAMQYATHLCALLEDGTVRCWGDNRYGQLGYGHTRDLGTTQLPRAFGPVDVGGPVVQISTGNFHTCAVLEGGDLRCWGRNHVGQLGYGHGDNIGDTELPAEVDPIDVGGPVKAVSAGRSHTCVLLDDGRVRCWGWNQDGQLGYGHTDNLGADNTPVELDDIDVGGAVESISAGGRHTCALLEGGNVRCWGYNQFGQLGYGHRRRVGDEDAPAQIGDIHVGGEVIDVEASDYHTCAILKDDTLRCWGINEAGQLGYGHDENIGDRNAPASAGPVPIF